MEEVPGPTLEHILFYWFYVSAIAGDGALDKGELKLVLCACLQESDLKLSETDIDQLAEMMFEQIDKDKNEEIGFEEMVLVLERYPEVMKNLSIR